MENNENNEYKEIRVNRDSIIKKVKDSTERVESIFDNFTDADGGARVIFSTLLLPEDEFAYVSEQILNEVEKGLNDPNEKLLLVQSINANGLKADDITEVFEALMKEVENTLGGVVSAQKVMFIKRIYGFIVTAINETEGIAKRTVPVQIQLGEDAKIPSYAKAGDGAMDLYATEDVEIAPGESKIIKTGIKCALPLGYAFLIQPRSGLSSRTHMRIPNSPGLIDSGYRGEIGVIIENNEPLIKDITFDEDGHVTSILYGSSISITKGMRFAQMRLVEVPTCVFIESENIEEIGFNRDSGFGGTGLT